MTVDDVVGAAFLPTDGQAQPVRHRPGAGARRANRRRRRSARTSPSPASRVENGRVTRRRHTPAGFVACEKLVHLRRPMVARARPRRPASTSRSSRVQHQYLITEPIAGVTPGPADAARSRPPDLLEGGGRRPDHGRLRAEPEPLGRARHPRRLPLRSCSTHDWDHFEPTWSSRSARVPALENAGIKQLLNGPESFTPDGNFILGEAPEVRGPLRRRRLQRLRHRLGRRRRHGAGRMGGERRAALRPLAGRHPPLRPATTLDRRLGPRPARSKPTARHYAMAWPLEEYASGRPAPPLAALRPPDSPQGAVFGEKLGWERPNWFADRRRGARGRADLRPPELVRRGRPRAPRLPRGGGALRPDLLRQVPADRARRRGGALLDLRQRRRQAARARSPTRRC